MRVMRELKKSAVVVWVRKTDTFKAVKEQMASIAEDEPDESTEFDGMVDLHWRFDSYSEAERLANSLQKLSHKPEIVVLRLSCYDDVTASVKYSLFRPSKALSKLTATLMRHETLTFF